MASLQHIYDSDPRLYRKDYGNKKDNERDFIDWCHMHQVEYKFESVIRRQYLNNYFGIRAYDLALALKRDYLLSNDAVYRIMQHILYYNKHVEIDQLNQNDERLFVIYKRPRFREYVSYPFSILSYEYYNALARTKNPTS